MKTKHIILSSLFLAVIIAVFGCSLTDGKGETVDINIQLAIPDYANHVYPDSWENNSATSRILDPTTTDVSINVSGTGVLTSTYDFDFGNAERTDGGVWLLSCVIPSVPVGVSRTFAAVTTNSAGTALTSGSATVDIYATGNNIVRIPLLPASATALTVGAEYDGSVAPAEMAYFMVNLNTGGTLTVQLTSAAHDVDLYVYNGDGTRYPEQFWEVGAPTDENATVEVTAANMVYLCVYGNTAGEPNLFTFNPTFVADDGDGDGATGTLIGGSIQGIDLGLDATNSDVATTAGDGTAASTDGTGTGASFDSPTCIATDGTSLFVADWFTGAIRQIDIATSIVSTLVASGTIFNPNGITTDGTNLYVADPSAGAVIQVVIATGATSTLAPGLSNPYKLTACTNYLWVGNFGTDQIIQMDYSGTTINTWGTGVAGYADGFGGTAQFDGIHGMVTDGTYVYVLEGNNNTVRRLDPSTATVTTLAGGDGSATNGAGWTDGSGAIAQFNMPDGITCDGTNLYITERMNHRIRKMDLATNTVSTIAGDGTGAYNDALGLAAQFDMPRGITTDGTSLYIADYGNNRIRQIQ